MSSYLFGFCFCVGSLIFNFLYSVNLGQKILTDLDSFKTFGDYMLDLYIKPWGRCTPYFMGLFLGIFYTNYIKNKNKEYFQNSIFHKLKLHFEVSRIKRIVCELFGFCLLCFLTFLPRSIQNGSDWPLWAHALYWTFSKPIFILGMILIVLPTIIGVKNSFFCTILNNKLFSFIAKISFCTYLVHLMVVYQYIFSRFADNYYSITNVFVTELGILVISLFFGFLLTILV
jgi:peptidoglycan/LPS O-acetylase OafA/YrhL